MLSNRVGQVSVRWRVPGLPPAKKQYMKNEERVPFRMDQRVQLHEPHHAMPFLNPSRPY